VDAEGTLRTDFGFDIEHFEAPTTSKTIQRQNALQKAAAKYS
jgi:hypothetical protein